jgi:hypothetical protein
VCGTGIQIVLIYFLELKVLDKVKNHPTLVISCVSGYMGKVGRECNVGR